MNTHCLSLTRSMHYLSSTFDTIKAILRDQDNLTFSQVVAKLKVREDELKKHGSSSGTQGRNQGHAFYSGGGGGSSSGKQKKDKCYVCNKKGHYKSECYYNPKSPNYKQHLTLPRDNAHEDTKEKDQARWSL